MPGSKGETMTTIVTRQLDNIADALMLCNETDWQRAQDRVLRYLKSLGVPPLKSLEIATVAIRRAASDLAACGYLHSPSSILHAAMGELRSIIESPEDISLPRMGNDASAPADEKRIPLRQSAKHAEKCRRLNSNHLPVINVPVMPKLNRGRMVPEKLDRNLVKTILALIIPRKAVNR